MLRISKFALLVRYIQEQFCKPAYKLLLHVPSSALSRKKSLALWRIPYWLSFPEDETYIPCYHFYLSIPHSTDLYRCLHSSNCRTPGQPRLLLTSSAITGGPVRTYPIYLKFSSATPKPSSICLSSFPLSNNRLSSYSQLLRCIFSTIGNLSVKFQQMYSLFLRVCFLFSFFKISTEKMESQVNP